MDSIEKYIHRLAIVITSLGVIGGSGLWVSKIIPDDNLVTVGLCIANIIVLITYCLFSAKKASLSFSNSNTALLNYCRILNVYPNGSNEEKILKSGFNNNRVNILVEQFKSNVIGFAITCIVAYIFLGFGSYIKPEANEQMDTICRVFADLLAFIAGSWIFLAFQVLHDKTLDANNEPIHYWVPVTLFTIIFAVLYLGYKFGIPHQDEIKISSQLRLCVGFWDGLCMVLLFAKYIAMEHAVGDIKKLKYAHIISFGVITVLPIYAVGQVFFGNFEIEQYTSNPVIFANAIFLTYFIGKVFFLYITYTFRENKLLHLYLHLVITRQGVQDEFDTCFDLNENNKIAHP